MCLLWGEAGKKPSTRMGTIQHRTWPAHWPKGEAPRKQDHTGDNGLLPVSFQQPGLTPLV
jgi:hypothetical protein